MDLSEYIIFADESGDHGLASINPEYPVFVLSFCIFKKYDYIRQMAPLISELKFDFFGHDNVILHAHDIRKSKGSFRILLNPVIRSYFIERLNEAMETAPFTIIATVINKTPLKNSFKEQHNPYDIALLFCLERLSAFMKEKDQHTRLTHILVEGRGTQEDKDLELAFRRICDGQNDLGRQIGKLDCFDMIFTDKKTNSIGLQIADLVAHPIGRNTIKPEQENRAFDIIKHKFWKNANGIVKGYGCKIFP